MSPSRTPHPTRAPDVLLPGPAPGARTSVPISAAGRPVAGVVCTGVAGLVAGVALHALWRVRVMRAHGTTVRPLVHDVDMPGRFPPRSVVVLGDSAAAGHGLTDPEDALARRIGRGLVRRDGRATAVRSIACDGATTSDVLATQIEPVRGAELVVIGVGVNDATDPRRRLHEAAGDLRRLVDGLASWAGEGVEVVVLTCPDLSAAPGVPRVLRPWLGARCRALAAAQVRALEGAAVTVVPAGRDLLEPRFFGPDGFHPGADGHAYLATAVLASISG